MSDIPSYPCAWNARPKAWNLILDIQYHLTHVHGMPGLKPGI